MSTLRYCLVLWGLVLLSGVAGAALVANGTIIEQGATIFIGEEGLNVTHALNGAYFGASCGVDLPSSASNSVPNLTGIGWWASAADIYNSAPSRTIDISTRYKNLMVSPSDFVGYPGNWYLLGATGRAYSSNVSGCGCTEAGCIASRVFTVQDPSLDIRIWDYNRATDVNGETIPLGTRLVFRIDTNMYGAANDTYRSPLNPATDGFINITVKNETGFKFSALYNDSTSTGPIAGPHSLLKNFVDTQPYFWGSPGTYSWKTDARDSGTYMYPAGTYTVSAESTLNHMRDNYKMGGADYTGKTVSHAYTVTLAEGIPPAPVANFTADITSGETPLTVTFTDRSTGTRTAWNWTFGDGDTTNATKKNPVHTYTASGTHDVSLVVYNATSGSDSMQKSGYITVTSIIEQGDTIFIGEEGLNVTHALNGAYYGASCGVIIPDSQINGEPPLTSIGWWPSAADIYNSAPSRTIDLSTRYKNLMVSPSDFVGYTGNWYLLEANGRAYSSNVSGCGCTAAGCIASLVFTVADPSSDLPQAGVTSITPNSGPTTGNTPITIRGTNFVSRGSFGVKIGGVAATNVARINATTISARTPAGIAGARNVIVTNYDGQTATKPSGYTYVAPPTISSITPDFGPTTGNTLVTIRGTNFVSGGSFGVKIGGVAATNVARINATTINAQTPAGIAGARYVVVTNKDGQTATKVGGFTYGTPLTITSITPNSGPTKGNTWVKIRGTNFVSGGSFGVKISGVAATNVARINATTISARTPAGIAGARTVVVTNNDGKTATKVGGFTYVAPPTISSITPNSGPTTGNTWVKIRGTNFVSGGSFGVKISGVAATNVTRINATTIRARTPAGIAGARTVMVTNKDGQTATKASGFTYL